MVRHAMGLAVDDEGYTPTQGMEVYQMVRGNPPYCLDILDMAGDHRHQVLDEEKYYAEAYAIIIVTDREDSPSFQQWV